MTRSTNRRYPHRRLKPGKPGGSGHDGHSADRYGERQPVLGAVRHGWWDGLGAKVKMPRKAGSKKVQSMMLKADSNNVGGGLGRKKSGPSLLSPTDSVDCAARGNAAKDQVRRETHCHYCYYDCHHDCDHRCYYHCYYYCNHDCHYLAS